MVAMLVSKSRRQVAAAVAGVVLALLLGACSSSDGGQSALADEESSDQGTVVASTGSTTTTIPPGPPEVRVPESTFALVGQPTSEAVVVTDPNNDDVVVRLLADDVPGLIPITNVRGRIIGFDWEPTEAGEWTVEVTATDPGGLVGTSAVRLIARHESSVDMFLALGDSIAAGFGRDRSDFTGADGCFRSEADSYGALSFADLVEAGALSAGAELVITACAGVETGDLVTRPTSATNGDGAVVGDDLPQLERATLLNPTIVTLTVGATEVGLYDLEDFLLPDAGQDPDQAVDEAELSRRTERIREQLTAAFDHLITTTSAHIVLTTAFNPVAANPIGVEGCTGPCMVAASDRVTDALNEVLIDVASNQRDGRVSIARLDGDADVWEAPNGLGLDALRDGLGPLQGVVDNFTGGATALCADDGGVDDPLISSLDCAHPNGDGHRAIADVVTRVLLSI